MEQVGWKLIDAEDNEIQSWGGISGQYPSIPNPLILPSGMIHIHSPSENTEYTDEDGKIYRIIRWDREVVPYVPQSVTMAQARIALQQAGLLATIDAGLNALPEPQKTTALTAWEYSPTVSRNGTFVTGLASQFGLTEQDLDNLFIAAGQISL